VNVALSLANPVTDASRRFLRAAVAVERPDLGGLLAAGVRHWEAGEYLRRLEAAGELRAGVWVAEARIAYSDLLQAEITAAAAAAPSKQNPLSALAEADRPREKAMRDGIEVLSDAELLALLLRTGTAAEDVLAVARRLLDDHDGLVGLSRRAVYDLAEAHGLGPAKAAEMAAAFELGRRLAFAALRERPVLDAPEKVAEHLTPLVAGLAHEEFWCLPLDVRSRLIGRPRVVSRGDVDATDAGPRAFFRIALAAGATTCIAVHNHPTGDHTPSAADIGVTKRLVKAGRLIDVELVDHIVLGSAGMFTSIRRAAPQAFA
jgi:DNA repair protein RadC